MPTPSTFRVGDQVVWAPDVLASTRRGLGEGPFTVTAVNDVPADQWACGHSFRDPDHYEELCGTRQTAREAAGHHQLVTVEVRGEEHQITGALLTPRLKVGDQVEYGLMDISCGFEVPIPGDETLSSFSGKTTMSSQFYLQMCEFSFQAVGVFGYV